MSKATSTESIVAKGAREARQQALCRLLDIAMNAGLDAAIAETDDYLDTEINSLARQLADEAEMDRAFLKAHGNDLSSPRQTLAKRRNYANGVKRKHDAMVRHRDADNYRRSLNIAKRKVNDAMERALGEPRDQSVRHSDLDAMSQAIFTEPVSLTPPGEEVVMTGTWTKFWNTVG